MIRIFSWVRRAAMAGGLAVCLSVAPAWGQSINIGVVNLAQLLDESPQARSAMQALQDEFAPRRRELVEQTKALQTQEETLQRDLATMSEDARRSAERDLREKQRDLARRQNEYLEDLNLRRNEELASLQRSLMQEVQSFAQSANYDLIVGDGVLYASSGVDITAQVLARLQSTFQQSQ